jgi:hypothetical protein
VTGPEDDRVELEAPSVFVSYGWGVIQVAGRIGDTG